MASSEVNIKTAFTAALTHTALGLHVFVSPAKAGEDTHLSTAQL